MPEMSDDELNALRTTLGAIAQSIETHDHERVAPPADLWARIDAAIEAASDGPGSGLDPHLVSVPTPPSVPGEDPRLPAVTDPLLAPDAEVGASVVDIGALRSRRRRGRPRFGLVAAAASVALLLAGGIAVSRRGGDGGVPVSSAALSNAGLSPQGAASAGSARVVRDGLTLALDLQVTQPPNTPGAYMEIWMIDTKVKGMVSLGPYHGNGRYPIPSGIDPAAFPVVDVSIEPTDGQPTHSGNSIVRGVLQ